jgi:Domain of unknown function DUF29
MYSTDFNQWAIDQAAAIRAQRWHDLDIQNLAEEVESMGNQERRELASRLTVLIGHLLKWQYQPSKRGASWETTIRAQRKAIEKLLKRNPSLNLYLAEEAIEDAYPDALALAVTETGLEEFPEDCPYAIDRVLDEAFLPE